jgi:hypothetical protein
MNTNTGAKGHIDGDRGDGTSADNDQKIRDGLTTKPKEPGQPSPSPHTRLEHGRQTPNLEERRECATPQ